MGLYAGRYRRYNAGNYKHAQKGKIRLAFTELEILFRKLQDYYEYQEECEIDDECGYCIMKMADIADAATDPHDKEFIFERCIGMCGPNAAESYGADFDYRLLKIAISFINQGNRHGFEDVLKHHDKGWDSGKYMLVWLDAILRLDGESAANAYVYENLGYDELREIAYKDAVV